MMCQAGEVCICPETLRQRAAFTVDFDKEGQRIYLFRNMPTQQLFYFDIDYQIKT